MPIRDPQQTAHARKLRASSTPEERILWPHLRKLRSSRFRRQVVIGGYICDFACHRNRLVIELDGAHHDSFMDATRDAWLRSRGYVVLRFRNDDIFYHLDKALASIRTYLA